VAISYLGIRVTDLTSSTEFYCDAFGLSAIRTGDFTSRGGGRYILLEDEISGQRLELDWYPKTSTYANEYDPGEWLNHVGVQVDGIAEKP
jgi:catechol 2,3-dioxygenase-like lactoylglutathione lyase family enzyme